MCCEAGCERNGLFKSRLVVSSRRRVDECVQDEAELALLLARIVPGHEVAGLGGRLPIYDARVLPVLISAYGVEALPLAKMVALKNSGKKGEKMEV